VDLQRLLFHRRGDQHHHLFVHVGGLSGSLCAVSQLQTGGYLSMKHIKIRHTVDTVITYIIILAISLVFLFPILWLLLASFSRSGSLYSFDGFFPTEYSLDSFKKLFTDTALYNYPRWFGNTLFVASMSCLFGTALTILTAYCMSRY